jgi:hypothetical protein
VELVAEAVAAIHRLAHSPFQLVVMAEEEVVAHILQKQMVVEEGQVLFF